MADWRDVMEARKIANEARGDLQAYGGAIEDGREGDMALAALLGASAICLELRALGTVLDHALGEAAFRRDQ